MLIHHDASSMIEKITKLNLFIYIFIIYFSFELENRKEQIVVLWLGRVPRDKSGMVNCHSVVG
jgi:hypothetical protein